MLPQLPSSGLMLTRVNFLSTAECASAEGKMSETNIAALGPFPTSEREREGGTSPARKEGGEARLMELLLHTVKSSSCDGTVSAERTSRVPCLVSLTFVLCPRR